jgi:hypothetical protein
MMKLKKPAAASMHVTGIDPMSERVAEEYECG